MSHEVTNDITSLWNELKLTYDKAVQRFSDRVVEIDAVFSAADNLRFCIHRVDGIANKPTPHGPLSVDEIDELHTSLWSNIEAFDSISQHSKALFTLRETPVSWRGKEISNIVEAIRNEAMQYYWILQRCSLHDTFLPSSQLREIHPEPWFDISTVEEVARRIRERLPVDGKTEEKEPAGNNTPPFLGLVFHHDSTVSRRGDEYKSVPPIQLTPQRLKLLKCLHDAGSRGRTKNELIPEIVMKPRILTSEKNRLNEDLIPLDLDLGGHGEYVIRCKKGVS